MPFTKPFKIFKHFKNISYYCFLRPVHVLIVNCYWYKKNIRFSITNNDEGIISLTKALGQKYAGNIRKLIKDVCLLVRILKAYYLLDCVKFPTRSKEYGSEELVT